MTEREQEPDPFAFLDNEEDNRPEISVEAYDKIDRWRAELDRTPKIDKRAVFERAATDLSLEAEFERNLRAVQAIRDAVYFLGRDHAGLDDDDIQFIMAGTQAKAEGPTNGHAIEDAPFGFGSDANDIGGAKSEASENEPPPELDPHDPMRSARALVSGRFTDKEQRRLLHYHRGAFYRFGGGCYRSASPETMRATVWKFLESAVIDKKEKPAFKPTQDRVNNVAAALAAVCHLDEKIDPPAWLNGHDLNATELLPVANGLLHLPTGKLIATTPAYFGLTASDVVFNPTAPIPEKWLHFLRELWGDDKEAVATLQMVWLCSVVRHIATKNLARRRAQARRKGHDCSCTYCAYRSRQHGGANARRATN
jgi:hypothetical protein